jgi:hypothetical protein
MSTVGTAMGINITQVSTTQLAPLGFIHADPASVNQAIASQGAKAWIYVKAGAALAAGDVCVRQGGTPNYGDPNVAATGPILCAAGDDTARVVGVAQHAIPQNSYGFIQRTGIGLVTVATSTADLGLICAAAGDGQPAAAITDKSFATALVTAGAPAVVPAWLQCTG